MSVWDELVGQDSAIKLLKEAVWASRGAPEHSFLPADGAAGGSRAMAHTWLITGPAGSGRSNLARAFAAALECTDPNEAGCGHCSACRSTLTGSNTDVKLLSTSKVIIPIDEIRSLVQLGQQAPAESKWRIIVIEDADRMAERSTNLLLKSIEEPPAHTVWILCTMHPSDVLPTIRSRCRHLSLTSPSVEQVANLLVTRDNVPPELAKQAAQMANCHVGLAKALATHPELLQARSGLLERLLTLKNVQEATLLAVDVCAQAKEQAEIETQSRFTENKNRVIAQLGDPNDTALDTRSRMQIRKQLRELEDETKREKTRYERDYLDRVLLDALTLWRDVYALRSGALSETELINVPLTQQIQALATHGTPTSAVCNLEATLTSRERLHSNCNPLLVFEALLCTYARQRC